MWLVVVMLLYGGLLAAGFESATLVMTSKGSQEIAQLKQGQILRGPTDSHYTILQSKKIHYCQSAIILTCGNTKLITDPKQRFFDAIEHIWVRADELHAGQWLATIFNKPIQIDLIEHCSEPNVIIQISVNYPHIFAVSDQGILAHNEPITAVCFFYCGPPIVAAMTPIITAAVKGISIGLTTYISWILTKNALKNAGAFPAIKNFLQSAWDKIRSKLSGKKATSEVKGSCGSSSSMPHQTELPVCGLQLPLPWQILPETCQSNLESKSEPIKTCEVVTPEIQPIACGTGQIEEKVQEDDKDVIETRSISCSILYCQSEQPTTVENITTELTPSQNESKKSEKKIEFFEKNINHIFRDKEGHLKDNQENRDLLIAIASNSENFLGVDQYGNTWFAKILPDGKQVWVISYEGMIRNGGVNDVPRVFNAKTGLCNLTKKKK